jgi:hypothetical protein
VWAQACYVAIAVAVAAAAAADAELSRVHQRSLPLCCQTFCGTYARNQQPRAPARADVSLPRARIFAAVDRNSKLLALCRAKPYQQLCADKAQPLLRQLLVLYCC